MAYYEKCSICGANLDPGERCDCIDNPAVPLWRIKKEDMSFSQWKAYKINKALGFYDDKDDINDKEKESA